MNTNRVSWPGWETVRLIGRGSFGGVYEIQRDVFGHKEKAALKVISIPQNSGEIEELYNDGYDDASITKRFHSYLEGIVKEYALMSGLKGHTNIVYCDDLRYVQHDNELGWDIFIKMELLTPLPKFLEKKVTDEQVIKVGLDICDALILCKEHNIVHRDIKPQNIFVSDDGNFKLGDFGIAKTAERTTSGTKTGTYKYMAPEVYNNQPYGSAADVYSLGIVLYWLLNDRRTPFLPLPPKVPTATEEDSARNRRFTGEPLPSPIHGSRELKQIVLKACAFDPKERYGSASEMKSDLEALLYGLGFTLDFIQQEEPDDVTIRINEDVMETAGRKPGISRISLGTFFNLAVESVVNHYRILRNKIEEPISMRNNSIEDMCEQRLEESESHETFEELSEVNAFSTGEIELTEVELSTSISVGENSNKDSIMGVSQQSNGKYETKRSPTIKRKADIYNILIVILLLLLMFVTGILLAYILAATSGNQAEPLNSEQQIIHNTEAILVEPTEGTQPSVQMLPTETEIAFETEDVVTEPAQTIPETTEYIPEELLLMEEQWKDGAIQIYSIGDDKLRITLTDNRGDYQIAYKQLGSMWQVEAGFERYPANKSEYTMRVDSLALQEWGKKWNNLYHNNLNFTGRYYPEDPHWDGYWEDVDIAYSEASVYETIIPLPEMLDHSANDLTRIEVRMIDRHSQTPGGWYQYSGKYQFTRD